MRYLSDEKYDKFLRLSLELFIHSLRGIESFLEKKEKRPLDDGEMKIIKQAMEDIAYYRAKKGEQ